MQSATDKLRKALSRAETWISFRDVLRHDPCVYCTVWPIPQRDRDASPSIEHITPVSAGGLNNWRNLASAHCACNASRSSVPLLRFFLYRQRIMGLHGKAHRHERARLRRALKF